MAAEAFMGAAVSKSSAQAMALPKVMPVEAQLALMNGPEAQQAQLALMNGPPRPAENGMAPKNHQEVEPAGDVSENFDMGGFSAMKEVSPALAALMSGSLG